MSRRSRRCNPRSTASAVAMAWGTEKQTVEVMVMPRAVASSMAWTPAFVTGSFTRMLSAMPAKTRACSTMAPGFAYWVGSTCTET